MKTWSPPRRPEPVRRRLSFLVRGAVVLAVLAIAPSADAAGPAGTPRLGVLGPTRTDPLTFDGFLRGLGQIGYVDGKNVVIEQRDAGGRPELLGEGAADLVRNRCDVIFARGPGALAAAWNATRSVPIVAVDLETDPVAAGFVKSLARPGGNVTGVFLDLPELSGKQLQLLREIMPKISRVSVLGDPALHSAQFQATAAAGRTLGMELQSVELRGTGDFGRTLDAARSWRAGAVLFLSSPLVFIHREELGTLAMSKRLPTVSMFVEFAEAGGLMAYGPSVREAFQRAGTFVGRILQGARAADLPVERPEKFDLLVNLKTARALGLAVPRSVLARADRIIE